MVCWGLPFPFVRAAIKFPLTPLNGQPPSSHRSAQSPCSPGSEGRARASGLSRKHWEAAGPECPEVGEEVELSQFPLLEMEGSLWGRREADMVAGVLGSQRDYRRRSGPFVGNSGHHSRQECPGVPEVPLCLQPCPGSMGSSPG